MSAPPLSDLFAAARADAPPDIVRDEVWGRVAAVTALPAAALAGKVAGATSAGKLLALGAVLGVLGTVVTALAVGPFADGGRAPAAVRGPAVAARGSTVGARLADPRPRARAEPPAASTAPRAVKASVALAPRLEASTLEEEARLVTEMRAALVRGDAEQALALARAVERLSVRALEPEELRLEVRALRALGRADDALALELTIRRRFPAQARVR
jgi:hypothetical protein